MRPTIEGGVILQGSRDRRYAYRGLGMLGFKHEQGQLREQETKLRDTFTRSNLEAADDSTPTIVYPDPTGSIVTVSGPAQMAIERADIQMLDADLVLPPELRDVVVGGITFIARFNKLEGAFNFVRPSVAAQMLSEYSSSQQ
jgi:hypothetical protein